MTDTPIEPLTEAAFDPTLPNLIGGEEGVLTIAGNRNPFPPENSSTTTVNGRVSHAQFQDWVVAAVGFGVTIETSYDEVSDTSTVHVTPKVDQAVLDDVSADYVLDEAYGVSDEVIAFRENVSRLRSGEDLDLAEINAVLRVLVGA
jgi:hypothetical protein